MQTDSKANIKNGDLGEELVAQFLRNKKFIIKEKKYRKRYGEIDLIAQKDNVLAFIEVKLRRNNYFDLSEVVNPTKQAKIILAAKEYLASKQVQDKICRFDVALVQQVNNDFEIKYIENAFTEDF